MKKFLKTLFLLSLIPLTFCFSCKKQEEFVMTAKILSVTPDYVEVEILSDKYNNGIMWVIISEQTKILSINGKTLTSSDLKENNVISIEYSGQVMLSYPAKINAIKITVKQE